jgi:DNA phosphorothioation-associated putative methyltransferase
LRFERLLFLTQMQQVRELPAENLPVLELGKLVARHVYVHVSLLSDLPTEVRDSVQRAERCAGVISEKDFNVVRIEKAGRSISLLDYPDFFDLPFPSLQQAWYVDFQSGRFSRRTYVDSLNPPILHRKELLLSSDHPRRAEYENLTAAAQALGLFDDPCRIGFKDTWEALVRDRGYRVVGHELVPIGNEEIGSVPADSDLDGLVARHLTALSRYGFSAPVQALARYRLLGTSESFFDYGCGKGDDVRGLIENGIEATGWDPYYAPSNPRRKAQIVNLGFVVNVIEDFSERVDALRNAFELSETVLAVSAMLPSQSMPTGKPYRDGFLSSRNTFQKYYTQSELATFIADVLEEEPIPVSPGVFFVFRDKDLEQQFLSGRQRSTALLRRITRPEPPRTRTQRPDRVQAKYEQYKDLLEPLWATWLRLGREPENDETDNAQAVEEGFGSLRQALRFIAQLKDPTALERAKAARTADLTVYLALTHFSKRKPYKHLETHLQRDIKALFGDYGSAQHLARQALFNVADAEQLASACAVAAENGLGWIEDGRSLQLHTSLIERLPTLLRVYISCGTVIYGDVQAADLAKIHIGSGKLTLMKFDDFRGKPLPRMTERIKLNLRSQDIEVFSYGEQFIPPYLYKKSRFINEEFPGYAEQIAFEEVLEALGLFDFSGYGPRSEDFDRILAQHRWQIDGFNLVRSKTIPSLDDPCGRHLTYRQLIECGETQCRTGLSNLPKEPNTYNALYELATKALDPIIEYFGSIRRTYGFCSSELAKQIGRRISPSLDQHASHEKNRNGRPICERLGAAVDFLVEDENMEEVAKWIAANTPFDRLYYYGADRPLHLSVGPENKREFIDVLRSTSGSLIPRVRRSLSSPQG